jgi:hypothetical protein
MRAAVRRLREHLGRRGIALLLLGAGKVCFGLGFIRSPEPNPPGLEALTRWADIRCWASIWVVCGAVTFGSAWLRIGRDKWGFIAALVPPFVWGCAFLWGALTGEFARGLTTFGWYATSHIGMIVWAAGVPEYSVPHLARRERP